MTDNSSEDIDIVIDNSTVNVDAGGTYTISYSASDSSGNTTKERGTVTVLEPDTMVDERQPPCQSRRAFGGDFYCFFSKGFSSSSIISSMFLTH